MPKHQSIQAGSRVIWKSVKAKRVSYRVVNTSEHYNGLITATLIGVDEEVPIRELEIFDPKTYYKRKYRIKSG